MTSASFARGYEPFSVVKSNTPYHSPDCNSPEKKTTAAEIGEAVMAICDATTAMDSGRAGRMLFSLATSVMTGIVENAVCPVPAMIVIR